VSLRIGITADGRPYELPADVLTHTIAILAKKGAGKTYAAGVIEEEFSKAGLPFVVLDPVGVHHGIRSSADGKREAYPIVVFGGEHADVPIQRHMGAEVARAVIGENISCIVDLTELSKTAWREFVRDFCLTLYKENRSPRHVFIEEATEFVPQTRRPELQEAFEAVERLVRMGRNRGLGCTLISQRSAQVAKDVLTQIDILIALRTVGPQDRRALLDMFEAVLEEQQLEDLEQFKATITKLPNGMAWVWWPERGQFVQVSIRQRETYHAGATPSFKAPKVVQAKPDVSALRERFKALATPPASRGGGGLPDARLKELEGELGEARHELEAVKETARIAAQTSQQMLREKNEMSRTLGEMQARVRAADQLRDALAALGLTAGDGAAPVVAGLSRTEVEAIVREAVASIPTTGGHVQYVPAPEAIRKGYQRQTVERAMVKIDGLDPDECRALRFMLGHDVFLTVNRIALALSGNDSGSLRDRWSRVLKELEAKRLVAVGGTGRQGRKPRLREWVASELAPHSPSDQEVEEVYQAVLGRIAKPTEA